MSTVLLVDDDPMMRSLMCRVFQREGDVPIEAKDGAEALAVLGTILPDLVVLDLEMPEVHGLELLERMREHPRWRDLPTIVLSGVSDTQVINRVQQLGAKQYFLKAAFSVCEMLQQARQLTARHGAKPC